MKKESLIKEIANSIDYSSNEIKDYGNGIIVTKHEEEVLSSIGFNPQEYSSLSSLIFEIENYLEESSSDEYDELDDILNKMSERNYYLNTNK